MANLVTIVVQLPPLVVRALEDLHKLVSALLNSTVLDDVHKIASARMTRTSGRTSSASHPR